MGQIDYAALAKQFGGTTEGPAWHPRGDMLPGMRPAVTDEAGQPPGVSDSLTRLLSMLEPMAHPQTVTDFGNLILSPTDVTRGALQQVPQAMQMLRNLLPSRHGVGSAVERLGQELQQPMKVPGRAVEAVGKRLRGPQAPTIESPAKPMGRTASAPIASSPVETPAPAPPARPASAPPPAPQTLDQLVLTAEERTAMDRLIQQGYSRKRVMQAILRQRQSVAPEVQAAPATGLQRPKLNAAEAKEFQRLKRAGKSDAEAFDLIRQLKAMQERLGLPTSAQTRQAVLDRNATGRWPIE